MAAIPSFSITGDPRRVVITGIVLLVLAVNCSPSRHFKVIHQTVGYGQTNCYLLRDTRSNQAALFDVGGPIDTLTSYIDSHNLRLKYIFITHCHPDHVCGLPAIEAKYPEAKICISREDYEDTRLYSQWEKKLHPDLVAEIKKDPEAVKLMNFDYASMGKPDIYLEDNQIYRLGGLEIRTLFSPGHSRGGVCFLAGNCLFSGDVLFYRSVGRTDLEGASWEKQVESVRRLYSLLPDTTVAYPGHGQFTDIGSEKKFNKKITVDIVNK
jgi:glyoxylase-like metal-dependent hydrolase (beta-lactamase superfamily II)